MGQRPSFSHLTGYPEAVASAQDFAPYGHTEQWQQLRSGGEMTALNPTGEGPGGEVTRLWRGDCLLRATRCRLRAIRWAITLWPLPFSEQTAGRDKRENTTSAQINQLPYIDGT